MNIKVKENKKERNRIDTLQPYRLNDRGKVERNKEFDKHYPDFVKDFKSTEVGAANDDKMREQQAKEEHQRNKSRPKYYV